MGDRGPVNPGDDLVLTGMGVVTPVGDCVAEFWDSLLAGRSGLRRDTRMDLTDLPCGWVAGLLDDQAAARVSRRSGAPGRTWTDTLLHDAVDQALRDARVAAGGDAAALTPGTGGDAAALTAGSDRPVGLVWSRVWPGPTGSSPGAYADHLARLAGRDPAPPPSGTDPRRGVPEHTDRTAFPVDLSRRLGVPLVATRVEATCAGGLRAIVEAARLLRTGRVDVAVVCSAVSRNTPYVLSQYAQLMAMSRWTGDPAWACRPFDRKRRGMVLNECAGALVLETAAHARARGAGPGYARVAGWGLALTTDHVTAPDVDAVERVMRTAVASAGLTPDQVDTVNAHGTATRLNDLVEARALHRLLGERTPEVPVSAVKSLIGHGAAASGVVETVAAALTLVHATIPPVVTRTDPDPECAVTTCLQPLERPVTSVVKNSFGFGGQYASVLLRRE